MTHARLAILASALLLPLTVAAGPALAASGRLMPTAPGLATSAPPPAQPRSPTTTAGPPAVHGAASLPRTGFPVGWELMVAVALGVSGAGLRRRSRPAGLVHLQPVPPGSR